MTWSQWQMEAENGLSEQWEGQGTSKRSCMQAERQLVLPCARGGLYASHSHHKLTV